MGTWRSGREGVWECVIRLTLHLLPPPPRPKPSTQIEMDFGVIRHTESFSEEDERDRLVERA